jgi:hypothetical protein
MASPEDAEGYDWDDYDDERGNVQHLAPHGITPDEAEEVHVNGGVFVPNARGKSGDWKLVGKTDAGRALTLVLSYEEDRRLIRFFTGWECTQNERTRYLRG